MTNQAGETSVKSFGANLEKLKLRKKTVLKMFRTGFFFFFQTKSSLPEKMRFQIWGMAHLQVGPFRNVALLLQDTFLPHVENGTITLIGATTENPSFQLNNALLSRCRVIVLEKLTTDHVEQILRNAVDSMGLSTSMESLPGKRIKDPLTTEYRSDLHASVANY